MKNVLCTLFLAGTLAAQAQTQPISLLGHIPADADKVYQINLGALQSKIDWFQLMSMMNTSKLGGTKKMDLNSGDIQALMSSGIDFHSDVIIAQSNAYHADSIKYFTVLIHLTDSGKFAAYVRKLPHPVHMLHFGANERAAIEDEKAASWTDNFAAIVIAQQPKTGSAASQSNAQAIVSPQLQHRIGHRATAALHGFSNTYFTTEHRFIAAFSDDGDFHLWSRHGVGFESLGKLMGGQANAQLQGLAALTAKSNTDATIGTLRFEAGKMTYRSLKLVTPAERASYERIQSPGFSNDLVAAIAPGELMALVTIHYNMAAWIDSIGKMPMAAMFTGQLSGKGIKIEDFGHALKGNFMILAYTPDKNATGKSAKTPGIYAIANINDKGAFDHLATSLKLADAASTSSPTSSTDTTAHHSKSVYYTTQNGIAVIGGSQDQVSGFFSHPAGNSNPAARLLSNRVNDNSFTLNIDMHALADFLKPILTKEDTLSAKNQSLLNALQKIDVMQVSAGAFKDDAMESYFELRFTDQSKNALADLIDIIGSLSKKNTQE